MAVRRVSLQGEQGSMGQAIARALAESAAERIPTAGGPATPVVQRPPDAGFQPMNPGQELADPGFMPLPGMLPAEDGSMVPPSFYAPPTPIEQQLPTSLPRAGIPPNQAPVSPVMSTLLAQRPQSVGAPEGGARQVALRKALAQSRGAAY